MPAEYGACLNSLILGIIPHSVEPTPAMMPRVLLIKIVETQGLLKSAVVAGLARVPDSV